MSEKQFSNPTAKPCAPSQARKFYDKNEAREYHSEMENSTICNQSLDQSNSDNENYFYDDDYDIGSISNDVVSSNTAALGGYTEETISLDEEDGGGRNGVRANMGDVMRLNERNGGYDPLQNQFNNNNGNDFNFGDTNDPNDSNNNNNNFYEDNSNFGDGELQIVVNGNDTNFFV